MKLIQAQSIAEAHESLIHNVTWGHEIIETEDGESTWESQPLTVEIPDPLRDQMIHPLSSFQQQRCEIYTRQILTDWPSEFDYTYHERLFEYPGCGCRINQIYHSILKLKESPNTRRALCITWNPQVDNKRQHVPCLQYVQFLNRNGKLNCIVLFRSEDVLSAFGPNAYGLARLQEYVASQLDLPVGSYTHIITVPHLYHVRDAADLKRWF